MRAWSSLMFTLLWSITIFACDKSKDPASGASSASVASASPATSVAAAPSASVSAAATPAAPIVMKTIAKGDIPKDIKFPGKLDKAVGWTDKNGANVVVFSTLAAAGKKNGEHFESAYLNVEHVAYPGGTFKSLRSVKDKEETCDADLMAEFRDKALTVTDLDNDGFGEITFAYALRCTSDVSPATLKLLMLENGEKYILRGQSRVDTGPEKVGGAFKVDPSFNAGPPAFLEHAKKQWSLVKSD